MKVDNQRTGFHGEVLFNETILPKKTEILDTNILQGSSQPGHEHIVKKGTFELHKKNDELFLVAKNGVVIGMKSATERHADQDIPDGTTWLITRAREADHFSKLIRSICD